MKAKPTLKRYAQFDWRTRRLTLVEDTQENLRKLQQLIDGELNCVWGFDPGFIIVKTPWSKDDLHIRSGDELRVFRNILQVLRPS